MAKTLYKKTVKKVSVKKIFISKRGLIGIFGTVFILIGIYFAILRDLPSPTRLRSQSLPQSTHIYDRKGTLLYTIYGQKNQTFIPLKSISKYLPLTTIAIEDRNFYHHGAIDIRGIFRAIFSILFKQQIQGGSTLTQQLVKNSLLSPEQTVLRKVKEVVLAYTVEALYSKDEILEMYLNQSPYGGTAWGVEAASQTYFGKSSKDLDLAESALLAGLPEAPTTYSPFGAHPEFAKQRQEEVLTQMSDQGYISKDQLEQAKNEKLNYKQVSNNIRAPHFVLYVKELLENKYGQDMVEEGGLNVTTSLDLKMQDFAQDTVATEVANLKQNHVSNGAALITHPGTGEILAMVGSRDFFDTTIDGNVNVTLAHRQPGSSIKPINYAVGLIKGYTAATPLVDEKVCFPGNPAYCPVNYDGKFHGVVQMRYALGNSFNIPAVKMLKLNTLPSMLATASAMGISTLTDPSRYGLSLTLGGGEIVMTDMATAFGVFANGGYRVDLHPILKVTSNKGATLEEYKPAQSPIFGKQVLPEGVAFIISNILSDNSAREAEFGANSPLRVGNLPVSVKTGTTNDFKDNWTIGYTPDFVVATWVGNNDNTPMSGLVSGITGAAPIWHKIMTHLLDKTVVRAPKQPSTVIGKTICATSGLLPPPDGAPDRCPTRFEYFIQGTEPIQVDNSKQKIFIDKTTQGLPKPGQTDNLEQKDEVIVTDPSGDRYCVTCPLPQTDDQKKQ